MADIVKINKNIQYQTNHAIHFLYAGETRTVEFINKNFASHIIDAYLKDGTFTLFQPNEVKTQEPVFEKQEEVQIQQEPETQEPVFEIMYKTTQSIQDKDGNEIEVGTQLTQKELKEKGFTKKKLEALLQEEKLMEIKVAK